MKTLVYTSIYTNLWGTEFGGRPSREYHYKSSLYNILNIKPSKVICFTSEEELPTLENYFYKEKKVDQKLLEFKVFNLRETKYFDKIRSKKNIEAMKQNDRCFEIQYNKFFWLDIIPNIDEYDRVFWIDAGLSHTGLFPEKYSYGVGHDKYFLFNVFNEKFLNELIKQTEEKILIVGKDNTNEFYWSKSLPQQYYKNYDNSFHIIGGFFGGKTKKLFEYKNDFELLISEILEKENQNYMEELIMSCLYFNYPEKFNLWTFQDWYERPEHKDKNIKYFYSLFEDFSVKKPQIIKIDTITKILNKKYPLV
jgi:hypothetical protein